jgi:hypothetical protein
MTPPWNAAWCGRAMLLWLSANVAVNAAEIGEYQIKAVFLHNFASFISWPTAMQEGVHKAFQFCILGDNPFAKDLDTIVMRANKDHGLQRQVRYLEQAQDMETCHILYVAASEAPRQHVIINYAANYPLLTISSIEGFARQGGMIEFYTKANKVRFFINLPVLRRAGLRADANLLRLADVIGEAPAP